MTTEAPAQDETLHRDAEYVLLRRSAGTPESSRLVLTSNAARPRPAVVQGLRHTYSLRDRLDADWSTAPLQLDTAATPPWLLLHDPGGEPLHRLLGAPWPIDDFLRIAIGMAGALGKLHAQGLIHRDLQPACFLVDRESGRCWLTGFAAVSLRQRERVEADENDAIGTHDMPSGNLAYMAPEQSGRMNRSVDHRSDLYALGACLYEMLTGVQPLAGSDAVALMHAHVAQAPEPAASRVAGVPPALSALVSRLLAKAAEDRYQTATGLAADLRHCLRAWQQGHRIDSFALGAADVPAQLLMPERLYGRQADTQALREALQAVAADGGSRLVLVAGPSGIGKSSLVKDLQRSLLLSGGLFASGKAEPQQRNTPYGSLAQALQGLVRMLLGRPRSDLAIWKQALRDALGPNAPFIAAVLPELAMLLDPPQPLPALQQLPPAERQGHFQRVLQQFVQVFARAGQPLMLFLDDMQWLDPATLAFVDHLVAQRGMQHLLLVGAYRNDELDAHPALADALRRWCTSKAVLQLVPQPLSAPDIDQLIADALKCPPGTAADLAALVHQRTDGNPFFVAQCIGALADQGLLSFDAGIGAWCWDLERITREASVESLVDLMVAKASRLPLPTRTLLSSLACLGAAAPAETLRLACNFDDDSLRTALAPALAAGLLRSQQAQVVFAHDRVREAAYALVPTAQRAALHLLVARRLIAAGDPADPYQLATQFNLGAAALQDQAERDRVAALNADAARQARAAGAPASALSHSHAALQMLGPHGFKRLHALAFELHLIHAECAVLCGDFAAADQDLTTLQAQAADRIDAAAVCRQRIVLQVMQSDYAGAIATALAGLQPFGIVLPLRPSAEQVNAAYQEVMALMGDRSIEALLDLPQADDADVTATMNVLAELFAPACFTDGALALLHLCQMVRLTLLHGLMPASPHAFAWFGVMIGQHFGAHHEGHRFALLSRQLVQRHGQTAFEAKALFALEITSVWVRPLAEAIAASRAVFAAAVDRGDLAVACFACHHTVNDMLVRGAPLGEVAAEIERGLVFVRQAGFRDVEDELLTQQRFVMAMQGQTAQPGGFDGEGFVEADFEASFTPQRMPTMAFWYWVLKAQARFLAGRIDEARAALDRARPLLWSAVHVQVLNYTLFTALVAAADGDAEALAAGCAAFTRWHAGNPNTFGDKLAMLQAETARLQGRSADADAHYEQAIRLARDQAALPYEALAAQLAARCQRDRGLVITSQGLLLHARDTWLRWGATGLARQLDSACGAAHDDMLRPPAAEAASALERLDLATVMKLAQALAGEIELHKLVDTLLRLALEHAGATRGLLLQPAGEPLPVQALATLRGNRIEVEHASEVGLPADCPATLLQYVARSRQPVLLDDATALHPYAGDADIIQRQPRSVLCLPLLKQARLVGLLYLENNLTPHAFTPERFALLALLASQAAIALENAGLYEALSRENRERRSAEADAQRINLALQDSEGRFRRMAETTADIIWITDLEPERVLYASPSFERIWGRTVEALYADPRHWLDGIHPEDRQRIHDAFGHWLQAALPGPWEAEFRVLQPSGALRWIRDRGTLIADTQGRPRQVSGIATDITERRLAELALQASEQRFALAVAGSNDGIWDLDVGHGQMFMSERAQHLFGLQPGATLRPRTEWNALIVVHPDDVERQRRLLDDYIAGAAPAFDGEWRVRHGDGSHRWVRVRGLCVRDAGGRPLRLAGSVSDIDPHKRAQASLQQAQRLEAVGTLASGIAHDFNNILGAILGFGEMSLRNTRAGSRLRRDIECIMTAGERGRSLVERILAFSRSGSSERRPVHVEGVVREALGLLAPTLPVNVQLQLQLEAGRAALLGDATQVHQVVLNLATNALQAMPDGGTLQVALQMARFDSPRMATTGQLAAGDYLSLRLTDSGGGIAPEIRERIFDPFVTTKKAGAGSGLGLSLVHGIVAEFGGAVDVSSTPGSGSTFTVYLPCCGEAPDSHDAAAAALPRGRHQRVLVVDDEAMLVRLGTETLVELGYAAVGFTSSSAALAAFRADPGQFDAVLTDERMPEMSGSALIAALQALRPGIPVILMSGHLGPELTAWARAAGVAGILNKPVARRELAAALRQALRGAASAPRRRVKASAPAPRPPAGRRA